MEDGELDGRVDGKIKDKMWRISFEECEEVMYCFMWCRVFVFKLL